MPVDLRRVGTETLEKRKAAIEAELKERRLKINGVDPEKFGKLHSLPHCVLRTVYRGRSRSGFINVGISEDEDYEHLSYKYVDACLTHNSESALYETLTPIDSAIRE